MTNHAAGLPDDLLQGLDNFIVDRAVPPNPPLNRDGALEVIVRDWLQSQGYVPLPGDDGIVPVSATPKVPNDG